MRRAYAQRRFGIDEALPWDIVDIGVTKDYLREELDRAMQCGMTQDCVEGCTGCGLQCAGTLPHPSDIRDGANLPVTSEPKTAQKKDERLRVRVRFSKTGRLRYLSHLELLTALMRALRRAGVPVVLSEGFHPKPILSFGPPLGVGVAGEREFFDMEVTSPFDVESYTNLLNATLPDGLCIGQMAIMSRQAGTLGGFIKRYQYRITGPEGVLPEIWSALKDKSPILIEREGKKLDLACCIESVEEHAGSFLLTMQEAAGYNVRLGEAIETLFGMKLRNIEATRTAVYGMRETWVEPL